MVKEIQNAQTVTLDSVFHISEEHPNLFISHPKESQQEQIDVWEEKKKRMWQVTWLKFHKNYIKKKLITGYLLFR